MFIISLYLFQKRFNLKNVSKTVGKFQLMPLPKNSKFHIGFDLLPGITKMVAPGLSLRMKVEFCTDSLEDEQEHLNILVDGGMKVSVTLLAYREAPQLKGMYFMCIIYTYTVYGCINNKLRNKIIKTKDNNSTYE